MQTTSSFFSPALRQIVARMVIPVAIAAFAAWRASSGNASAHQIGTHAIVFDQARAYEFLGTRSTERIRVVDFGLEDGRGIAYDRTTKRVYVADAWDTIHECELERRILDAATAVSCKPTPGRLPDITVCPDGECAPVDHGGVLFDSAHLLIADAHQGRVLKRSTDRTGPTESLNRTVLRRVHDIARIGPNSYIVSESAFPKRPRDDNADEPADDGRGAVHIVTDGRVTPVDATFTHPVGVAYYEKRLSPDVLSRRLYVADISDGVERWRYFEAADGTWKERGILWTQPLRDAEQWPPLQAMVIGYDSRGNEAIFAAGPDGLYLFDPIGTLIAKYALGTPVAGLAWGEEGELFLTVDRKLCMLQTISLPDPPRPADLALE
jgi:hypothetical protein